MINDCQIGLSLVLVHHAQVLFQSMGIPNSLNTVIVRVTLSRCASNESDAHDKLSAYAFMVTPVLLSCITQKVDMEIIARMLAASPSATPVELATPLLTQPR